MASLTSKRAFSVAESKMAVSILVARRSRNRPTIELARQVAEAETDLVRIRQARLSLLEHNGGMNNVSEEVLEQLDALER